MNKEKINQEEKVEEEKKDVQLKKHIFNSTNIEWASYDENKKELYIHFHSNSTYVYYNVPKNIFVDLLKAGSKGRYHAIKIKYKFKYQKLS